MIVSKSTSLKTLLQDFYNLTGIKTCVYDLEGNELSFYPEKLSSFCKLLRSDEEMYKKCCNCDRLAFANCRKSRSQYIYTCHAGLQECISPIIFNDRITGFIMIGQIKKNDNADFDDISNNFPSHILDDLRINYDNLPVIPTDKLLSACRILDTCAGYDHLRQLVYSYNNTIDVQLDQYIHNNLGADLSIKRLCSIFHLSHAEIYTIFKEYFCTTPAEYVKEVRLNHACKLLLTTKLKINQIAIKCGIPDYNYFSKIFKSLFKKSPTEYRRADTYSPIKTVRRKQGQ